MFNVRNAILIALTFISVGVVTPIHAQYTWTEINTATDPAARFGHSMTFNSATNQVVMFGGDNGSNPLNDIYTYDGTNWTSVTTNGATVQARKFAPIVYDAARNEILLFGGQRLAGATAQTFTLSGSTWTNKAPATQPSARYGHAMTYDSSNMVAVLHGGTDGSGPSGVNDETWIWDGSTWTQDTTGTGPGARVFSAMVYDSSRAEIVLFGGYDGTTSLNDTWVYAGGNWIHKNPSTVPSARSSHSLVFDDVLGKVVMYGGVNGSTYLQETYTWDGNNWTLENPASAPTSRSDHNLAYDSHRDVTVFFGGNSSTSPFYYNDTWEYGTFVPPTATPTATATNTPTSTSTPTSTPTSTFTSTPTETNTPAPTLTFTATPTLTLAATSTPTLTATSTSTPSNSSTNTPSPTNTPRIFRTSTPTPTITPTPVATATINPSLPTDPLMPQSICVYDPSLPPSSEFQGEYILRVIKEEPVGDQMDRTFLYDNADPAKPNSLLSGFYTVGGGKDDGLNVWQVAKGRAPSRSYANERAVVEMTIRYYKAGIYDGPLPTDPQLVWKGRYLQSNVLTRTGTYFFFGPGPCPPIGADGKRAEISGRVTNRFQFIAPRNASTTPSARAELYDSTGMLVDIVRIEDDGTYVFDNVAPDTYTIQFRSDSFEFDPPSTTVVKNAYQSVTAQEAGSTTLSFSDSGCTVTDRSSAADGVVASAKELAGYVESELERAGGSVTLLSVKKQTKISKASKAIRAKATKALNAILTASGNLPDTVRIACPKTNGCTSASLASQIEIFKKNYNILSKLGSQTVTKDLQLFKGTKYKPLPKISKKISKSFSAGMKQLKLFPAANEVCPRL